MTTKKETHSQRLHRLLIAWEETYAYLHDAKTTLDLSDDGIAVAIGKEQAYADVIRQAKELDSHNFPVTQKEMRMLQFDMNRKWKQAAEEMDLNSPSEYRMWNILAGKREAYKQIGEDLR